MTTSISQLPNESIAQICSYTDLISKSALSMVNHRIQAITYSTVRCIRIFPPYRYLNTQYPASISHDILVKIISRYSRLNRIIFGAEKNTPDAGFGYLEAPYLNFLINHLINNPNSYLKTLKQIQWGEVNHRINRVFLKAICKEPLSKIRIETKVHSSLTDIDIQMILNNCPNLKTFSLNANGSTQRLSLSFVNQHQLSKIKILQSSTYYPILNSLENVDVVKELIIDGSTCYYFRRQTKNELEKFKNLERLELIKIPLRHDELRTLLRKLPSLKCLRVELEDINDMEIMEIGNYCPHIRMLEINRNRKLISFTIDVITKRLPHLEVLCLKNLQHGTQEINTIAKNCKHLRLLKVTSFEEIDSTGLDALVNLCPDLKILEFYEGAFLSIPGLIKLTEKLPQLKEIVVNKIKNIDKLEHFYQKYPKIKLRAHQPLGLKALYKLTI